MTAAVELFTYDDHTGSFPAEVRVVINASDGEPRFVAADLCALLDVGRTHDAVRGLDADEKGAETIRTPGGDQEMTVVTEAGMYALILRSRKPEAKAVRRWITHDVLPAIRRTGSYSTVPMPAVPQTFAEALRLAADEHERAELAEARNRELEPKAEVADRLLNAEGDLSVRDAAQALTRAGVKVGQTRLFTMLETRYGWISRAPGDGRYRVKQAAIESGWMSVIPQSHYHPKTGVLVLDPPQPRVTPKGLQRILVDHGGEA
ncbi:MAG: BRO family protein [Mycobacterium kyogaense]|uniref:BRO family protein n=1 Tax=Mycobacterium kyogaense TaxID=2212479 RepID=UPI002FFAA52E